MRGSVYRPILDPAAPMGVGVGLEVLELQRLAAHGRLMCRYVEVRNGGAVPVAGESGMARCEIPHAEPDTNGDFLFRPGCGGARMDQLNIPEARCLRYIETSHFAEVNTYYHLDQIARYIHGLLVELGAPPLPAVIAIVNAHNGCNCVGQMVDGVQRRGQWVSFQGGHYRLPGTDHDVVELRPVAPTGEIHLGSGRRRLATGALARLAGKPYRHNAGHNAGIIYHEYGHHIHRHTADFRANNLRPPLQQSNRKVSMDEGTCDYWAAVMMRTPHIWAWHRRHDEQWVHRRSLTSTKTMAEYDRSENADPHVNGTIWGACLWDLRTRLQAAAPDGGKSADKLVLQALLMIGRIQKPDRPSTCRVRSRFRTGLRTLLDADQLLTGGTRQQLILDTFNARSISLRHPSEVSE